MKKYVSLCLLMLLTMFALVACGGETDTSSSTDDDTTAQDSTDTTADDTADS